MNQPLLPLCIRLLLTVQLYTPLPTKCTHVCIYFQTRGSEKKRERETEGKTQKSSFPLADVPSLLALNSFTSGQKKKKYVEAFLLFFLLLLYIYFRLDYFHLGTRIFTVPEMKMLKDKQKKRGEHTGISSPVPFFQILFFYFFFSNASLRKRD